jgi:hypothetical protein
MRHFAVASVVRQVLVLEMRSLPLARSTQVITCAAGAAEACVDVIATRVVATRMLEMSSGKSLRIWCTDLCDPKNNLADIAKVVGQ